MSLRFHRLLNRVLPYGLKNIGRRAALRFIPSMRHLDMPTRLRQLQAMGVTPKVILDIGAASGEWARFAHEIWPGAKIYGFEPNVRELPQLEKTRADLPAFEFFRCFLGPETKTVQYNDSNTQTSLLSERNASASAEAPMCVLDQLLSDGKIEQPQLIKLDVQGFELEVLKGATQLLRNVDVAILEISLAAFHPGMPVLGDVADFMRERGFVWYDIVSALRRAGDDRLMQVDGVFLRAGHPLLNDRWD